MAITGSWSGGGGRFSVLVHGGAGAVPRDEHARHAAGCRQVAEEAARILRDGGAALDAVEHAVRLLEDDPRYNAGVGAALTDRGEVELDASIMDGRRYRAGAVCAVRRIKNPVIAARAALEDGRHVLYAANGAEAFAEGSGISLVDPETLITEGARARLQSAIAAGRVSLWAGGTVGAVARDRSGDLAAATSTGGTVGKRSGRVGDSPLIGAGTYADNEAGAASATGSGESILLLSLASRAVEALRAGQAPDVAAKSQVELLEARLGASAGLILVDREGRLGWARNTGTMSWAACSDGAPPAAGV